MSSVSILIPLLAILPTVASVTPRFLWGVINATLLEQHVPEYCPKLIFHNNLTLADADVSGIYNGAIGDVFVDLEQTLFNGDCGEDWDKAEKKMELAQKIVIEEKNDPCLAVLSFVFDSVKYDDLFENVILKQKIRHRLSDLLQFSTPVRNRLLVLVRISEELSGSCPKGPKYPTRLVPQWELLLFDFFQNIRLVQGPFHNEDEPYVRVSKENGFRWLCDDIIQRLEHEKLCKLNMTCLEEAARIQHLDPRVSSSTDSCKLGFRPRQ